jgi:hypothetical protein
MTFVDGVRRTGSSCATRSTDAGERRPRWKSLRSFGEQRDISLNTPRA